MEEILERKLFSVGDDVYCWADVVRLARARGDWSAIEAQVRAGIAALRELGRRGEAPGSEALEAAEREFRYEWGLLAADELETWLDVRGVSAAEWDGYLMRELARERLPGVEAEAGDEAEVEAGAWAEGICSGTLEQLAQTLASFASIAPGLPPEQLEEAFDDFSRRAATEEAIAREIEANRLEWIRVRYESAAFGDEDSAREAALCVRSDGDPLTQVAVRAGTTVEEREDWLDDVEPELATRFLTSDPGDLIGPIRVEDRFLIAHVQEKTPPSLEDEIVRGRAASEVAERAIAREVDERVIWLEPL